MAMIQHITVTKTTQRRHRSDVVMIGAPYLFASDAVVISDGAYRPAATRGDSLRLEVASVESASLTAIGTIGGVNILAVGGANGIGAGTLRVSNSGTRLAWCAPGSVTFGSSIVIEASGNYIVEDGENEAKWLRVSVNTDFIPTSSDHEAVVQLYNTYNNAVGHDDVTAGEATAGDITTYQITMANDGPAGLLNFIVWIAKGWDRLEIGKDGSNWYRPWGEHHAESLIWAELKSGSETTLHVRRTIAAGAASNASVLNVLGFAWDGC